MDASRLAAALVVALLALLGLVGAPPTAVFVGKPTTASAAWHGGYAWLAVVSILNSLIGLFYYLRRILPVVSRRSTGDTTQPSRPPRAVGLISGNCRRRDQHRTRRRRPAAHGTSLPGRDPHAATR